MGSISKRFGISPKGKSGKGARRRAAFLEAFNANPMNFIKSSAVVANLYARCRSNAALRDAAAQHIQTHNALVRDGRAYGYIDWPVQGIG